MGGNGPGTEPLNCLVQLIAIGSRRARRAKTGHGENTHLMTQFHRLARDPALAAAIIAFACVLACWPSTGEARKAKADPRSKRRSPPQPQHRKIAQEADQKKQAAAAARQAYDAGLKAFANGKYQPAIDQLSAAVKGGGLSSAEIAKALYTRGAAYKKQNKPGLAIQI